MTFLHVLLSLIILIVVAIHPTKVFAQELTQWSPRERIPGSHDKAETPYLVADLDQTIHAFYSQPVEDDLSSNTWAIFYSRWTLKQGWTTPIDIILSPSGQQAQVMGALLDQNGIMHLVFYGSYRTASKLYYSQASALRADRAPAWSIPEVIADSAMGLTAAMIGDGQGNLFVLYSGPQEESGVYTVHSTDGGDSWSDPISIVLTSDNRLFPYALQLCMDQQKQVHAVWSVNDQTGRGTAIAYAHLEADYKQWSEPIVLDVQEATDYQVGWPAIGANKNDILVVYLKGSPLKRIMRQSSDGGQTWTASVEAFTSEGEYGWADFATDSDGGLHILFGDRARGLDLWHSTWQGTSWREPTPVVPLSGLEQYYQGGPEAFHPWWPRTVVSQGNILFVVWRQDPGLDGNGSWYSYTRLNTPELPLIPIPTAVQKPAATLILSTPTVPATPTLVAGTIIPRQQKAPAGILVNPVTLIIFGITPVVLLITLVIIQQRLLRRQH